jgi:hypothetical protein
LPEWFTVESKARYTIKNISTVSSMKRTGKKLHAGLPVKVKGGEEICLLVEPQDKRR